jgi:gamma-glutamyltranspeptidase/glutathione hydrolase
MELAHLEWGQEPWKALLQPAADLAEAGFLVVPGMPVFFERRVERIRSNEETRRLYLLEDAIPESGDRMANPDLAQTIRTIAEKGRHGLYDGPVAEAIVRAVQAGGGSLTVEDFRAYKAHIYEPIGIDWQGRRILSSPPPVKGGATALLVLKLLEAHSWTDLKSLRRPANMDDWARAFRHVYPLIEAQIGDDPEARANWHSMMRNFNLRMLRNRIREDKEVAFVTSGASPDVDECTTHFVVADQYGNVASVTQSLSHHFGSGVIAPGTGVLLNNTLKNFSFTNREAPNAPAPGKRPTSTIAPVIVLEEGLPSVAIGLPGGQRIPTTLVQVLLGKLAFNQSLGDAILTPRFHLKRSESVEPDSHLIQLEEALPEPQSLALESQGWKLEVPRDSEYFGGVTAIEIHEDGTLTGWADPRRNNFASGF